MFKKITMSDYRTVAKDFDKRMAKQDGLPLWLRIVHAAGAEMNRSGHAYFGGWQNLADYVKVDGKAMPLRAKVYEGVKKAVELGYLSIDSDVDCLVFNSADSQKAAHSGYGCKSPKHKDTCRSAEEIAQVISEYEEELETPVGVDPVTGEVLEEAESASEETPAPEDQEVTPEPQTAAQSLVEVPEPVDPITLIEDGHKHHFEKSSARDLAIEKYLDRTYKPYLEGIQRVKWAVDDAEFESQTTDNDELEVAW